MVKKIPLQNGLYALVNDDDFKKCQMHIWSFNTTRRSVVSRINNKTVDLAHFILDEKKEEKDIIKKNGDHLDYTKGNLVFVEKKVKHYISKAPKNNTSGYKGVYWNNGKSKWQAQIKVDGKQISLGRYNTKEEAAAAYNTAALKYFGEHAFQNEIGVDNRQIDFKTENKNKRGLIGISGFKGVFKNKNNINLWSASITIGNKANHIGVYATAEDAAIAYDSKAKDLYGNKAILNFPENK